jgi:MFS family permease
MYIGLSLYLSKVIGFDDVESGKLLGNYRLVASLAPVPCGLLADRISFRRSLLIAFSLYSVGYLSLYAFPTRSLAFLCLCGIGVGGGFMKPVVAGTVVRTAPPGRQQEGFAIFYRMVNAGSVVGKTLAYGVRVLVSLRHTMLESVAGALGALALAVFAYREPERGLGEVQKASEVLGALGRALANWRLSSGLVVFAGFYFMAEQFYMTFPKYVTRHIDPQAPLEIITLINPATIALMQGVVNRATRPLMPIASMVLGVAIGALAMLVMGALPTLWGACLSGALFAVAEMVFSPRYYDYLAGFAPPGRSGMIMGLTSVPLALGGWAAGQISGPLIARYLPAEGARDPLHIWATYAALGLAAAVLVALYGAVAARPER